MLTGWLGLLAFSAFSDSVSPFQVKSTSNPSSPLSSILFLMLLAWWPYACWKKILERKPNTSLANVKSHQRVAVVLGILFTVVLSVAITFGIQNGNDRIATAQIEEGAKDFQDVAAKIGAIKSRDLRSTKDYIEAYGEIDPLLVEFDSKLQSFTDILSEAKERDRKRGPFNIQQLFGGKEKEWLVWDDQIFALLREDSEVTRKEVLATKQMATLPEERQVEFWNKNFRPLLEEENILRQKIKSAEARKPS